MQPKIKRVSALFRILFQAAFIIIPIAHALAWIYAPLPIEPIGPGPGFTLRAFPENIQVLHTLSSSTKFYGLLVGLIPVLLVEAILYFLIRLFRCYEHGYIFSLQSVTYIKKTAYALLILQLVKPITEGFITAIVTWGNPPGHRYAAISITGIDLAMVFTAFLIILISWIMAEGCRLHEEQQLTV